MKPIAMMLAVILLAEGSRLARADEDLYTKVFVVPSEFQTSEIPSPKQGVIESGEAAEDKAARLKKRTAKDILRSAGIRFREGASATYDRTTNKLIVQNTRDQMELVEAYIDWVKNP